MSSNFGDTFVESYKYGTKIAQDEEQHAKAVALEEEKLAATQAMEAVKMEALNKQIEIADKSRMDEAKYRYDTEYGKRLENMDKAWTSVKGDPAFARVAKTSGAQLMKEYDVANIDPNDERVPTKYFDLIKAKEMYQWQLGLADAREKAKELKDDEFVNNIMSLTKLANENAQGLMKQETIPAQEAGVIPKYFSEQWNQSSMKIILDKIGKLNLFGSGTPAETKFVTDESKLGPAMDKQAQIIQSMEALIMNKKVNPKLASTFLDPQKSALLEMVSSRLVNDDKGLPVLANTQGMNPTTISKVKDILDSYRMQQLIEKTKSLGEQKLGLQVEQLQEKVQ